MRMIQGHATSHSPNLYSSLALQRRPALEVRPNPASSVTYHSDTDEGHGLLFRVLVEVPGDLKMRQSRLISTMQV
jgi:hypothetical protein